jgi:hypothetical protein
MMKKLLSSSFERCFNKDAKDHMEDSTTKLAITMLEALKDLGILLSSLAFCGHCEKYGHWAKECPNIRER